MTQEWKSILTPGQIQTNTPKEGNGFVGLTQKADELGCLHGAGGKCQRSPRQLLQRWQQCPLQFVVKEGIRLLITIFFKDSMF